VAAEADQRDRAEHDETDRRACERAKPLAARTRTEHEERQRETGRDLDRDAREERRRGAAKARARACAQRERRRKGQQDQRVIVRAADREHEQHRVQPDERRRPTRRVPEPPCCARDKRDRGEARDGGQRLERPQRAGQAERRRRVAEQGEQRAVGGVLIGPADKREHFVAGGLRSDVRVWVETVQRAEPGEADVAEDVLGEQRRPEQQDHVRGEDRGGDRAERQRPRAEQHERVARAHDQRQRLEPAGAEAHAEALERTGEPARPPARVRGHVLRGFAGGAGARQEDGDEDADQPDRPERAEEPRWPLGRSRQGLAAGLPARGGGGVDRRARRGRGDRHRLIVTSSRKQACGGKCRIPSQARVTLAGLYR
jgi:hypothetical protein